MNRDECLVNLRQEDFTRFICVEEYELRGEQNQFDSKSMQCCSDYTALVHVVAESMAPRLPVRDDCGAITLIGDKQQSHFSGLSQAVLHFVGCKASPKAKQTPSMIFSETSSLPHQPGLRCFFHNVAFMCLTTLTPNPPCMCMQKGRVPGHGCQQSSG
jgi:hypothetical protein